jgi:hypothetical protein
MFHVAVKEDKKCKVWSALKIGGDYKTGNT